MVKDACQLQVQHSLLYILDQKKRNLAVLANFCCAVSTFWVNVSLFCAFLSLAVKTCVIPFNKFHYVNIARTFYFLEHTK